MKNKLKWKVRLFHINNSNDSVYLFLNLNHSLLLKSACTTRKAAQLITFDKFKNNVFLHVQMYAKIMIFCTKSARKIAEFQACIKLGKSLYSFHKCFTVQHVMIMSISGRPLCLVYAICYNHLMNDCFNCLLQIFIFHKFKITHTLIFTSQIESVLHSMFNLLIKSLSKFWDPSYT